jgi:hypothetical protein
MKTRLHRIQALLRRAGWAASAACCATAATQAPPPAAATACQTAEHRQFDFWIGRWDVFQPDGKKAGENLIEPILGGCVLRETWRGQGGFAGTSLNNYDPADGRWHQTWVDDHGGRLELAGRLQGRVMLLSSSGPHPDKPGKLLTQRIAWTPADDGSVRQLWETSEDGGATWSMAFDGKYVKRP